MFAWIISFATMLLLTLGAVQYANYVDRKSNQYWCELIAGLDERYQNLPPEADAEAREFAVKIHNLKGKLDC